VILLPGIFLLLRYGRKLHQAGRVSNILLSIGALVLAWPYVAAFALIVLQPWLAPATFNSTAIFSLPIRTAASLPFVVLILLIYAKRVNLAQNQEAA
jgi:hypothetical protein